MNVIGPFRRHTPISDERGRGKGRLSENGHGEKLKEWGRVWGFWLMKKILLLSDRMWSILPVRLPLGEKKRKRERKKKRKKKNINPSNMF